MGQETVLSIRTVSQLPPSSVKVEIENIPDDEVKVKGIKRAHKEDTRDDKENQLPKIIVSNIHGARLSRDEEKLKVKLMQDVKRAEEMITKWQDYHRNVKRQLRKVEKKQEQLRQEALQKELQRGRRERNWQKNTGD